MRKVLTAAAAAIGMVAGGAMAAGQAEAASFTFSGELQKQTIIGGAAAAPFVTDFGFSTPVSWSATFDVNQVVGNGLWAIDGLTATIGGQTFVGGSDGFTDLAGAGNGVSFSGGARGNFAPDVPGHVTFLISVFYAFPTFQATIPMDPAAYLGVTPFVQLALENDFENTGVAYSNQNGPSIYDRSQQNLPVITGDALPPGLPEPTTWALTIMGFLGVGLSLRRRRLETA